MADRFEVKKVGERFRIVYMGTDQPVTSPTGEAADGGGTEQEGGLASRLDQVRGDAAYILSAPTPPGEKNARATADALADQKKAVGMTQAQREAAAAKGERVAQVTSDTIKRVEAADRQGAARAARAERPARAAARSRA